MLQKEGYLKFSFQHFSRHVNVGKFVNAKPLKKSFAENTHTKFIKKIDQKPLRELSLSQNSNMERVCLGNMSQSLLQGVLCLRILLEHFPKLS